MHNNKHNAVGHFSLRLCHIIDVSAICVVRCLIFLSSLYLCLARFRRWASSDERLTIRWLKLIRNLTRPFEIKLFGELYALCAAANSEQFANWQVVSMSIFTTNVHPYRSRTSNAYYLKCWPLLCHRCVNSEKCNVLHRLPKIHSEHCNQLAQIYRRSFILGVLLQRFKL